MRRHHVLVSDPHPWSLAAAVLLRRRLRDEQLAEWLAFRADFLASVRAACGDLACHYCGKPGLLEQVGPGRSELAMLATLDHVKPRAKGGAEYDKENLVVACHPCNVAKGDRYTGP